MVQIATTYSSPPPTSSTPPGGYHNGRPATAPPSSPPPTTTSNSSTTNPLHQQHRRNATSSFWFHGHRDSIITHATAEQLHHQTAWSTRQSILPPLSATVCRSGCSIAFFKFWCHWTKYTSRYEKKNKPTLQSAS